MRIERKKVDRIRISHNWKLLIVIIILIALLGVLIYFILKNNENKVINKECLKDEDCVASDCCHAESCVTKDKAPLCEKIFCSQVCSGPLDCGAGHCGCVNEKCSIIKN